MTLLFLGDDNNKIIHFFNKESIKYINYSDLVKNSEKFIKAVSEGRIGSKGRKISEETKTKISNGVKKYFKSNFNKFKRIS